SPPHSAPTITIHPPPPLRLPPPPHSPLFPYTTLFRSPCRRIVLLLACAIGSAWDVTLSRPAQPHCKTFSMAALSWSAEAAPFTRSEEHTSELQSRENLVCRLLLEKKKKTQQTHY